VSEPPDIPIEEEFREAEREIAIEEIRMYRDKSLDEMLADYFAFLRSAERWCSAFPQEPRNARLARLIREERNHERDAYLERLDWLCNGP
jgi:hypothetical protein